MENLGFRVVGLQSILQRILFRSDFSAIWCQVHCTDLAKKGQNIERVEEVLHFKFNEVEGVESSYKSPLLPPPTCHCLLCVSQPTQGHL